MLPKTVNKQYDCGSAKRYHYFYCFSQTLKQQIVLTQNVNNMAL